MFGKVFVGKYEQPQVINYLFTMPAFEKTKPSYIHVEKVSNCCGVDWYAGFPHPIEMTVRGNKRYDYDKDNNRHLIEGCREDLKRLQNSNSVNLIVINHIQEKIYGEMIKEQGFTPIVENAFHSGHGHTLFIYIKKKHERTTPLTVTYD